MIKIDKATLLPILDKAAKCASGGGGLSENKGSAGGVWAVASAFDRAHVSMAHRKLVVRASDGVRDLSQETGYATGPDGYAFTANAKGLLEAVKMMPPGSVSMKVDADVLRVWGGSRSRDMKVQPAEEYPPVWDAPVLAASLKMPANALARLLGAVSWACGTSRWSENIHLTWSNGRVVAKSIDGRSLIVRNETDLKDRDQAGEAHVGSAAAGLVKSILDLLGKDCEKIVSIGSDERRTRFDGPDVRVLAMLAGDRWPEGFPCPPVETSPLVVSRTDLLASCSALKPAAFDDRIDVTVTHGELVISARDKNGGKALDKLPVSGSLPKPISVNVADVVSALDVWDSPDVAIAIDATFGPEATVFRPWPQKGSDGTHAQISGYVTRET